MPGPGDETELGGLARSIDSLFSGAPASRSTDDPGSDTGRPTRALVDAARNPRYDAAVRQRALVVAGFVIAVVLSWVLVVEASHHAQHLAEFNTDACLWSIAAAGALAIALVVTCWAWFRTRPQAHPLLTLEEIRQ